MNLIDGMIMKLQIIYKDYVRCQVVGLTLDDRSKVYDHFSIFVPNARFTPKYKLGIWDGYDHYFTLTGLFYVNLLPELFEIIDMSKYQVERIYAEGMIEEPVFDSIDETYLEDRVWPKGHRLEGQPVQIYEHQVDIVNACLSNPRCIVDAATGSGKSLIAMMLALEVSKHGRFILIEPSKDLTIQTAQVFRDLGVECGVCGCGFRELDKKITICTWQTIDSLERRKAGGKKDGKQVITKEQSELSDEELRQLTSGTVGIVFDEAHQMKAYNCKKICEETFKDVPLRWGLTGTIPKAKCDKYGVICAIGHVAHTLGSKELQDKGILAKCDISCIKLFDGMEFRTFSDELEYLSTNIDRLSFIGTLIHNIVQSQGNTLVLVNRIVCGKTLETIIKQLGSDCIFLDGSVKSKDRFREYESIKTENNRCIIATSQIAATGLSIDRLFNVVLLDYGKSFVKSIQSIGRGLRLGKDKDHCNIFDIFSTTKFSKKHFNDRVHYYHSKEFPMKVLDVEKWK